MAFPADHEAALVHLFLAEAVLVALFAMHASGNQMMLRQALLPTAQREALFAFLLLVGFGHRLPTSPAEKNV